MRIARVLLALVIATAPALARSEKTLAYPRDQAWPAAVRFIRVDEHLKVIEKDGDAGYVLFELHEEHKTFRGSLEVIDANTDGHHSIRFVIHIEDRPTWLEVEMLDRLERKLREELGSPAPAPAPKKPSEPKPDPDAPKKPDGDKGDKPADHVHDDGPPVSATP